MIEAVAATGSTNADLLAAARGGAPEGRWLRAERQTAGRGRLDRVWSSPPGNLHASTIVRLRPGDPPAPGLALVAGIALHEVASAYAVECRLMLKWPNDLLNDGAKLAGILLEREGDAVVMGFGVNLASHPADLGRPATDMALLTGAAIDPAAFVETLADMLARRLTRWRGEGPAPIRRDWLDRAHAVGTPLTVMGANGPIHGLFDGLDPDGGLRLRRADATVERVSAGDVELL